jgi:hypothetical protein
MISEINCLKNSPTGKNTKIDEYGNLEVDY